MTTLTIFRDIAPEFSAVNDAAVTRFIGYITCQVSQDYFGCDYELALAYLAADMIAISQRRGGVTGQINMKKEGELAIGYTPPKDDRYVTTYGQSFLTLMKKRVLPIMVTNYTAA
jgi:hypothetical protein